LGTHIYPVFRKKSYCANCYWKTTATIYLSLKSEMINSSRKTNEMYHALRHAFSLNNPTEILYFPYPFTIKLKMTVIFGHAKNVHVL
jgi:hypothetical protein